MPKKNVLLFFLLCCTACLSAQQAPTQLFYIQQFKDIAIREMQRTKIPASITLAQGLLESASGQSELAQRANNHFGIKCGSDWIGADYFKMDDDFDFNGNRIPSCFRSYETVEASFHDHSDFLTNPAKAYRYGALFDLGSSNYEGWAHGLLEAGYATSPTYPTKLIDLIQRYKLYTYDLVFSATPETPDKPVSPDKPETPDKPAAIEGFPVMVTTTNEVLQTFASGYETAEDIAKRTYIPLEDLLTFNEKLVAGYVLPAGEKIYLEKKGRDYSGPLTYHTVRAGQSMYDIAQQYGIRLDRLLRRNRLQPGEQPKIGQQILLKGRRTKTPPAIQTKPDTGFDEDKVTAPQPSPPNKTPPVKVTPSNPNPPVKVPPSTPVPPVKVEVTPPAYLYHTVIKDDTLWNIAQRYNTTVEQLKKLNALNNDSIQRGMSLRVK